MKLSKTLLTVLILVCVANAKAQTADDIIAKHVQAMGGKEAWEKINSIKEEGVLNLSGTELGFTIIARTTKARGKTFPLQVYRDIQYIHLHRAGTFSHGRAT